ATWERASGATSYEAQYAPAPVGTPEINIAWRVLLSQEVNVPKDGEGGKPSLTLSGLEYATRYAFRVRGNNELGAGAWSPVVYEVTASEPPQPEP
ncbi:fibronectin type III domain-containing protein, partial [Enterobacter hormaechei]